MSLLATGPMAESGGKQDAGSGVPMPSARVFIPWALLQGTELPIHVIWPPEISNPHVEVTLPRGFTARRANNTPVELRSDSSRVMIDRFESPGHLGLVVEAPLIDVPAGNFSIDVEVRGSDYGPFELGRSVHVFRPDINVEEPAEPIVVRFDKESKRPTVSGGLRLINDGEGIGLLVIENSESSEAEIVEPDSAKEFRETFWQDISSHFESSGLYTGPDATLFRNFVRVSRSPPAVSEKSLIEVSKIYDGVGNRLQADPEVARRVFEAFNIAFANNLNILTDVSVLLEYLRSVEETKLIILNVYEVVSLKRGAQVLELALPTYDLAAHQLRTPKVRMEIQANEAGKLPLHMLLAGKRKDDSVQLGRLRFKKTSEDREAYLRRRRTARG